jgi:hypothetical protein
MGPDLPELMSAFIVLSCIQCPFGVRRISHFLLPFSAPGTPAGERDLPVQDPAERGGKGREKVNRESREEKQLSGHCGLGQGGQEGHGSMVTLPLHGSDSDMETIQETGLCY